MINISINPPDFKNIKSSAVNKLAAPVNEMESICEYIAECVTDCELPESDEDEDVDTYSNSLVLYISPKINSKLLVTQPSIEHTAYYGKRFHSVLQEPSFPPPKEA